MPVHSATNIELISRASDPKAAIIKAVGDLSKTKVAGGMVLLGTYIRNEMTKGRIILPTEALKEDEYQGKVGLVLDVGPGCYSDWEDDTNLKKGEMAELHSWVVYQIKDAWPVQINGTACRMIPYDKIRMQIPDPSMVF